MNTFELISDLHKDARGFRPSQGWMNVFNGLSEMAKEETWDQLCRELADNELEDQRRELDAQRTYETRLAGMMADYGIDRATAIRWDAESFDLDVTEALEYFGSATQEIDHFLFKQGIAFSLMPMYNAEISEALQVT